jgi:hypothetical protein
MANIERGSPANTDCGYADSDAHTKFSNDPKFLRIFL